MHWCHQETQMVLMSIPAIAWLWWKVKLWFKGKIGRAESISTDDENNKDETP